MASKVFTHIRQVKDQKGTVLNEENKIMERWSGYFGHRLNEDDSRQVIGDGTPNQSVTSRISKEVKKKIKKIINYKVTEMWKTLEEEGVNMWDLMQKKVHQEEKMPLK